MCHETVYQQLPVLQGSPYQQPKSAVLKGDQIRGLGALWEVLKSIPQA